MYEETSYLGNGSGRADRNSKPGRASRAQIQPLNLLEIARGCLEQAGGDVQKATPLMERQVLDDKLLFYTLMSPLVSQACYDLIRQACRNKGRKIWIAPIHGGGGDRASPHAHEVGTARALGLLDMPLPGGKPLRECTSAELTEASEFYRLQGRTMLAKADFLQRVAGRLKKADAVVGDVLDEKSLRSIQKGIGKKKLT